MFDDLLNRLRCHFEPARTVIKGPVDPDSYREATLLRRSGYAEAKGGALAKVQREIKKTVN